jgi:hypothetical protein
MEAILKSQAAIEVLSGISLAEFLIFFSLIIGLIIAGYKFKDKIISVFENYHKKASKKEDMAKQIKECNAKIEALEKHHEEDVHLFEDKQLKYRQQSLDKQDMIDKRFDNVDVRFDKMEAIMEELKELVAKQNETIASHYKETERLKCNELREKLVAQYRHFTSLEMNPRQEWTILDAETFWELFADYEKYGGNGFMHSTVKPAMEKLKVISF